MQTKLRLIPKEQRKDWHAPYLSGTCPACEAAALFASADFNLIKSSFLKLVHFGLKPKKSIEAVMAKSGEIIQCQSCGHTMAFCRNCQIGFSVDSYEMLLTCPSCETRYTGYG